MTGTEFNRERLNLDQNPKEQLARAEKMFLEGNNEISREYGQYRGVTPAFARLLALIHVSNQYIGENNFIGEEIKKTGEEKRNKITELEQESPARASLKSDRKILEQSYDQYARGLSREQKKAGEQLAEVLTISVLDIFSLTNCSTSGGRPLIAGDFILMVEEIGEGPARDKLQTFLRRVGSHLVESYDRDLFSKYSYRASKEIITKTEDIQILESSLRLLATSNRDYQFLGNGFFEFLKHRLNSSGVKGEEYPYLNLIYDIVLASYYSGDPRVIQATQTAIDTHFGDTLRTSELENDCKKLARREMDVRSKARNKVTSDLRFFQELPGVGYYIPNEIGEFIASPEARITMSMSWLSHQSERGSGYENSVVLTKVSQLMTKAWHKVEKQLRGVDFQNENTLVNVSARLPRADILRQLGIEEDLFIYLTSSISSLRHNVRVSPELQDSYGRMSVLPDLFDRNSKLEQINNTVDILKKLPDRYIDEFFAAYFPYFLSEYGKNKERIHAENDWLWKEVLDNPVWFVSPKNDRYTPRTDPQLFDLAMQSVIFSTDKRHPREHRIKIAFDRIDFPFEFWLTKDRHILMNDRKTWPTDPEFKQIFSNILLRRLYNITSGTLRQDQQEEPEYETGLRSGIFEYRRAHYKTLRNERFTMQSAGAKKHAQEIKDIYGIDIIKETERRWNNGTLNRAHLLTFAKEVNTGLSTGANDVSYDPNSIRIPV